MKSFTSYTQVSLLLSATMESFASTDYRVLASYGRECIVEAAGERIKAAAQKKVGRPVCNDQVRLIQKSGQSLISEILPRKNLFARANRQGDQQIIAANLDRLIIVVAPRPEPTRDLINRYLIAAHLLGIKAVICLNKIDLLSPEQSDKWQQRLSIYNDLGYQHIQCSAKASGGLKDLSQMLSMGSSIFIGQSGVGKSSLINALLPGLQLPTQEISKTTRKGRHTTTAAMLHDLPNGGHLIDSPGVWEYGLWKMQPLEIAAGFIEFHQFSADCRFANCLHDGEPACAVKKAVETQKIHPMRYDSYLRIVNGLNNQYG